MVLKNCDVENYGLKESSDLNQINDKNIGNIWMLLALIAALTGGTSDALI
jgi:hypothetical protein